MKTTKITRQNYKVKFHNKISKQIEKNINVFLENFKQYINDLSNYEFPKDDKGEPIIGGHNREIINEWTYNHIQQRYNFLNNFNYHEFIKNISEQYFNISINDLRLKLKNNKRNISDNIHFFDLLYFNGIKIMYLEKEERFCLSRTKNRGPLIKWKQITHNTLYMFNNYVNEYCINLNQENIILNKNSEIFKLLNQNKKIKIKIGKAYILARKDDDKIVWKYSNQNNYPNLLKLNTNLAFVTDNYFHIHNYIDLFKHEILDYFEDLYYCFFWLFEIIKIRKDYINKIKTKDNRQEDDIENLSKYIFFNHHHNHIFTGFVFPSIKLTESYTNSKLKCYFNIFKAIIPISNFFRLLIPEVKYYYLIWFEISNKNIYYNNKLDFFRKDISKEKVDKITKLFETSSFFYENIELTIKNGYLSLLSSSDYEAFYDIQNLKHFISRLRRILNND